MGRKEVYLSDKFCKCGCGERVKTVVTGEAPNYRIDYDRTFANMEHYNMWRKANFKLECPRCGRMRTLYKGNNYPKCVVCSTEHHRKRRYGADAETVNQKLRDQRGLCAICGVNIEAKFYLDHNHSSGQIRGLLCNYCNIGLGAFKDSVANLMSAFQYLGGDK